MSFLKSLAHFCSKKIWHIITIGVLFSFCGGYIAGSFLEKEKYKKFLQGFGTIRENTSKYTFINPLIGNISQPATEVGIFSDLEKPLTRFLKTEIKKGNLYDYSFYFRDLQSGLWFGLQDSHDFFPASLFKLPIAIAAYKQGESDPLFLSKRIVFTKDIESLNGYDTQNSKTFLRVGATYSVEELIARMIIDSDNGAKDLLLSNIDSRYVDNLFYITSFVDEDVLKKFTISSRKYALLLRILYGSSYLNEEHSEKLLALLNQTTFKDGIVAGVGDSTPVAHKYGVHQIEEAQDGVLVKRTVLHDCGIVYHPNSPYLLCIMTKGKDTDSLLRIISSLSKVVFTYQSNLQ